MKVLIVYDTKHGTTEEVAGRIADSVKARGGAAELLNLRGRGAASPRSTATTRWPWERLSTPAGGLGGLSLSVRARGQAHGKRLGIFAIGADPKLGDTAAKAALPASLCPRSRLPPISAADSTTPPRLLERLIVKAVSGKAESSSTLDLSPAEAFGTALAG